MRDRFSGPLARPCVRRGRAASLVALVAIAALATAPRSAAAQSPPTDSWHVGVGFTLPAVRATETDFANTGTPVHLDASTLTFPHVAVGRRVGAVDVEIGYRKLGVLRYENGDGSLGGNTHANAFELVARVPGLRGRGAALSARVGGEVVRTIAVLDARPPGWPFAGGVNVWRVLPIVGADVSLRLDHRWGLGLTYAPVWGRLGTATETGRVRQQVVGVDLIYHR
jgi:hypothetical protein